MGKQWKQCQTLFLGSKITAYGDCSHEIKRHLLLGRKAMTNLDSILRNRDLCHKGLQGSPCGSAGKDSACNAGDLGWIHGLGRAPGEGNSYLLQCTGLENSMDCIVHGVTKSQTQLSDFHFHFPYSQNYVFYSSHIWMWELDHKEGWMTKNWCFQAMVLEKTLESLLDYKDIIPVSHWKYRCWSWSSSTLSTWCKGPTHLKRCWCWEDWR